MKYKIHITTNSGELLDSITINSDEKYWNSQASKRILIEEIFETMENEENND